MDKFGWIERYLTHFLDQEVRKSGLNRVVLGLSGGIDSAVVAVLAHRIFGEDLLCVMMPSHYSSQESINDAMELIDQEAMRFETHSIAPMLQAYEALHPSMTPLRMGNLSARLRMLTLFDLSAREGALVLGTSNKSELMLGYGTWYGDLASAINPIGDLYKTEVFALARHLGVPRSIIDKPPSADLWAGQSDEAEIGYAYEDLDRVLQYYVEERRTREEIIASGEEEALVDMILHRIYKNQFKRKMPLIAKLTSRTINHDFNYPRDITL